jgi:hypothetical protein
MQEFVILITFCSHSPSPLLLSNKMGCSVSKDSIRGGAPTTEYDPTGCPCCNYDPTPQRVKSPVVDTGCFSKPKPFILGSHVPEPTKKEVDDLITKTEQEIASERELQERFNALPEHPGRAPPAA